ncbi:hypothetical protein NQ317_010586 [Molorchus minor]|uniref:Uncharacterized protein n=1 Tax=Molorchus minor TaxID=1323400 RepID=A0ABQ9IR90_9CUCU|nr:hypothetical protein NQ317_010586 [Molorchus minor]
MQPGETLKMTKQTRFLKQSGPVTVPGRERANRQKWTSQIRLGGRQYEANWEDAQKSLSNNSSASNSWDKYSYKSIDGSISSRLGQYQSMLDDIKADNDDLYALPNKGSDNNNGSIRLKYHSEKCLSRINSKNKNDMEREIGKYFLPSQSKVQRERSFKTETPKPKPRKKMEKFKIVIDDLQQHIKKSVRFDETSDVEDAEDDRETTNKLRVTTNPLVDINDKFIQSKEESSESEHVIQERISTWIDDQNRYIQEDGNRDETSTNLKRNDSGYYEHSGKPRQRLPRKTSIPPLLPRLPPARPASNRNPAPRPPPLPSSESDCGYNEVYSLYKNGSGPKRNIANSVVKTRDRTKNVSPTLHRGGCDSNDFLIPRPKLIVPVHTYAVRRRRTGNILSECYDSDVDTALQVDKSKGWFYFLGVGG